MFKAIDVHIIAAAIAVAAAVVVLPAAAHSPLAVDQQGKSCVQMDCQNDKITSRCNFPVQLTHECGENRNSHCAITASSIYNSAVENGVTVVGVPFASSVWKRNILRPDGFYPMDIDRKGGIAPIDSDSKDLVHGYACAIHTDGSVTSAGTEWQNDENGNAHLVCVHTHTDGSKHTAVAGKPDFQCPGEFVNNWAAECLEYETKPLGDIDSGTRLTNKCKCPVVVDACIDSHPCDSANRRNATLQPGESVENSPAANETIAWAACFQDDEPYTDDNPKSGENNRWTCSDVQTPCSKIEIQGDTVAMQFQALTRGETVQETAGAKEGEQPAATEPDPAESNAPLVALRGASPPSGTPTEDALRKCNAWGGQLSASAIINTEGNETVFHKDWKCKWLRAGTHLHFAALINDSKSALWLITNGAAVNAKSNSGATPLHRAASNNATETAALLLENGAEVNAKKDGGWTPLNHAALHNATETAALLLENGANVNAKTDGEWTSLHSAANSNATETAALLLENGAEVNAKDDVSATPLHRAADNNSTETAALLLENGARVNAKSKHGGTPLYWAARSNTTETAALLLKNGANVNAKASLGWTPLDAALSRKHTEIQFLLKRHGGRCNKKC